MDVIQTNLRPTLPFNVVVRLGAETVTYEAIGDSSASVHMAALDRFGVCGVTVKSTTAGPRSTSTGAAL